MTEIDEAQFTAARQAMMEEIVLYVLAASDQIGKPTLADGVLKAMAAVPRHLFVPAPLRPYAYVNGPLPIGYDKTISQPFIVAVMTDLLDIQPEDRILEVGTGLGYHAAILAKLAATVYSVEIIQELAKGAQARLKKQGYRNIVLRVGDGASGWAEHAPFDKITVAAAPELIPTALLNQLKPGGRMVVPAGIPDNQQLLLVSKDRNGSLTTREVFPVRFAPLIISH